MAWRVVQRQSRPPLLHYLTHYGRSACRHHYTLADCSPKGTPCDHVCVTCMSCYRYIRRNRAIIIRKENARARRTKRR